MRKFLLPILLALVPALAGCVTVDDPEQGGAPLYFVMRHLDTPEGQRDPDLLPAGQTAAAHVPDVIRARPRVIYVSNYKRTAQTAAAVAARYHLTPVTYDPADTPALIARVRAGPWPALIVGHSNTVPDIVEQLGGPRPAPLSHPDFGDIWRVEANGTTTKLRVR